MDTFQKKGFMTRESGLRQTIMRAFAALSVMVASLLLFMVMPFFPREVMILVAIALGALAYKVPSIALVLMVLLALPGYIYQLGSALPVGASLPIPVLIITLVVLLTMAALAGQFGGVLGITTGVIATVLMLSPAYYLALPMIIGIALLRTRYQQIRVASAILTFVVLYYPILAISAMAIPDQPVPILQQVSFHSSPPMSVLTIEEISLKFNQIFDTSHSGEALAYTQSLTQYWPMSLGQRLLPVGILFGILVGAAVAATAGMMLFFRWLDKREVGIARLSYAAPIVSLLVGVSIFIALVSLLARPLNYETMRNPFFMIGTGIFIGGCGSLAEVWLKKRDVVLSFREQLADRAAAMQAEVDFLTDRTERTKAQCQQMDTSTEDALRQMCGQELAFTEQAIDDMSVMDLEQKVLLFEELQGKLHEAIQESNTKLCQYHDEDWERYNNYLTLANGYGFSPGEYFQSPDFSSLISMEYDEVLDLQTILNQHYESAARALDKSIDELEERLCSEVDPDFNRTGINIARDYFEREHYAEAVQEFLLEAGDIEQVLSRTLVGLDEEMRSVSDKLKTIIIDVLIPTAVNLGDTINDKYYHDVVDTIDSLNVSPVDNARLPELMITVSASGCLRELIALLSSKLGEKISSLESNIQDKTPRGYSWGVDPEIRKRVTELSQNIGEFSNGISIRDRMSFIKQGPPIIDSAARVVKDYSIAHELLINYANIEYILKEKLAHGGIVNVIDLPLNRKYALQYMELYRLKHLEEVFFEKDMGRLTRLDLALVV